MVPLFPNRTGTLSFLHSQIFAYLIVRAAFIHRLPLHGFDHYCNCLCAAGNVSPLPVMSPHAPFSQLLTWIQLEDEFVSEHGPDVKGEIRIPLKRIFIIIW